jgi:thiosulfate/3-mercaptopyruvate sulfurtransferase
VEAGCALVDVGTLVRRLASERPPVVLDVRWTPSVRRADDGGTLLAGSDRDAYLAGHLPGAVFCDLDADLAGPPGEGGRHPLPTREALTAALRRWGVSPTTPVVVHDTGSGPPLAAARAWWVLRWAGHADVRVLDGGLAAWTAAGHPLEPGEVVREPADDAEVHTGSMPVVGLGALVAQVEAGGSVEGSLVDVRAAERFSGETEPVDPVAGHVPGATNLPVDRLVGPDGRLLAGDELRSVLGDLAVAPAGEVAASCGSGVAATVLVLALHEVGVDAALFPGSWSQWTRDPSRPVEVGS